jgi:hypothetical protein
MATMSSSAGLAAERSMKKESSPLWPTPVRIARATSASLSPPMPVAWGVRFTA